MKKKLLGLVVCVMLMTTFFTMAIPAEKKVRDIVPASPLTMTSQVDVPIWEINDQWTYKIDNTTIVVNQNGTLFDMDLTIGELPLTVNAVDETSYTVGLETSISGRSNFDGDFGDGPVNISIAFSNLKLSGNIIFEKSTLGIKEFSGTLTGRFWVKINEQPYLPIPFFPKLPVKIVMNLASDFSTPISPLTFPLNDTMIWNLTATNLTLNGEIRSPWLYIMLFINSFKEFLPPEIAALLPVIDIKDALTTLGSGNVIQLPMIAGAFFCLNTESVSVPAGTFDTYNITILNGTAHCFYAPAVGNIVKLTGNLQEIIPYITNINMELKSTNYS
jgi:hypothetical protein